jgi:hypothetical protein
LPGFIGEKDSLRTIAGNGWEALQAASRFLFAVNRCRAFHDIGPTLGGAMAKGKAEVNGSKDAELASGASTGKQADPEIDQAGAAQCLQKAAQTWLLNKVDKIIRCQAANIKKGHLSSAQALVDWALKLPADVNLAEKQAPSFAAELWEISKTLLADAGE